MMLRTQRTRRLAAGGFTLLELTIAIAAFGVGMLTLNAMLLRAMQGGSRGRHTTLASAIAESRMEQLQRLAWDQLAPTAGWTAPIQVQNKVQAGGTVVEQTFDVEWRVTDLVTDWTRAVDVKVSWDETGRPDRSVVFSSIRFNREGA